MFRTLYWEDEGVVMLDQRLLPQVETYNRYESHEEVAQAITDLVVRGAPAIGVAAAMGIALGVARLPKGADIEAEFAKIAVVVYLACALLLIKPGLTSDLIGLACLGALVLLNMKFQPRSLARSA